MPDPAEPQEHEKGPYPSGAGTCCVAKSRLRSRTINFVECAGVDHPGRMGAQMRVHSWG
jgi:hypothetical protein